MSFTITVNGNAVQPSAESFHLRESLNERAQLAFDIAEEQLSFDAEAGDPVVASENGTPFFAGLITKASIGGFSGAPIEPVDVEVVAGDLNALAGRRLILGESRPVETLKQRLTWLVTTYLAVFGVALHASQVDGPTLDAQDYDNVKGGEVLNDLSTATQFSWSIDENFKLRMVAHGSVPAPWDIADGDGNVDGDLVFEKTNEAYRNTIYLTYGGTGLKDTNETFIGDGTNDTFTLKLPIDGPLTTTADGAVGTAVVFVDGAQENIGGLSSPSGIGWEYDPSNLTIRRRAGAPSNGAVIVVPKQTLFPQRVSAIDAGEVAAHGPAEESFTKDDLLDPDAAQALVDGMLAQGITGVGAVRYPTLRSGLRVGMSQHIQSSIRGVDFDFLIQEIVTTDIGGGLLLRQVFAVIDLVAARPWQQVYRDWDERGSGGTVLGGSVVSGGGVTPWSAEYNLGGHRTAALITDTVNLFAEWEWPIVPWGSYAAGPIPQARAQISLAVSAGEVEVAIYGRPATADASGVIPQGAWSLIVTGPTFDAATMTQKVFSMPPAAEDMAYRAQFTLSGGATVSDVVGFGTIELLQGQRSVPQVVGSPFYVDNELKWTTPGADGTAITPAGSAYADSAWAELMASAPDDLVAAAIEVYEGDNDVANHFEIDIGVGGSGSEAVIGTLRGIASINAPSGHHAGLLHFPIPIDAIPSGSRIAARLRQASTDTTDWRVSLGYYEKPIVGNMPTTTAPSKTVPAASASTVVSVESQGWVDSGWVEVEASTPAPWVLGALITEPEQTWDLEYEVDIGIGSAGNEVVVGTVKVWHSSFQLATLRGMSHVIPLRPLLAVVPSGSRLSVRVRSDGFASGVANYHIAFVYYDGPTTAGTSTAGLMRAVPAGTDSVTVQAGDGIDDGSNGAFGPWTEVIASLASDSLILGFTCDNNANAADDRVQIGSGASSSETPVADVVFQNGIGDLGGLQYVHFGVPVWLQAGTRVSVRHLNSKDRNRAFSLWVIPNASYNNFTRDVGGHLINTAFTLSSTAWMDNAWEELADPIDAEDVLLTSFYATCGSGDREVEIDIGFGAAASEVVVHTLRVSARSNGSSGLGVACVLLPAPFRVPGGTRVSFRMRGSGTGGGGGVLSLNWIPGP